MTTAGSTESAASPGPATPGHSTMDSPRCALATLGCKLNQYESEGLAAAFRRAGFTVVGHRQAAELYLVNTCTVTGKSEQKARRLIRSIRRLHPACPVIVTGCWAELDAAAIGSLGEGIIVVPQSRKPDLMRLPAVLAEGVVGRTESPPPRGAEAGPMFTACAITAALNSLIPPDSSSTAPAAIPADFSYFPDRFQFHSRAFLKVQDGCDYACAYCRIRLARGPSRSLAHEEVLARVHRLSAGGYREIVVTGTNLCSYRSGGLNFPGLLRRILEADTTCRIRVSSLEPQSVNDELAELVVHPRVCPHFHLSLQSGADTVLAAMRRPHNADHIRGAWDRLRSAADPFLAADVLVGFPGEGELDFRETMELLMRYRPAKLHYFPFSPRPGTPAAHYAGRLPERIVSHRIQELKILDTQLQKEYYSRQTGRRVEVVPIQPVHRQGRHYLLGLTENYCRVLLPSRPSVDVPAGITVTADLAEYIENGLFMGRVPADDALFRRFS